MKTFQYVIKDEVGIHTRPAGLLVKEVKKYQSKVTIEGNGKKSDAGKLMAVMGMGIKKDMEVTITVEGDDEEQAAQAMKEFFEANL